MSHPSLLRGLNISIKHVERMGKNSMFEYIVAFMDKFTAGEVILFLAGIFFIGKWLIHFFKKIRHKVASDGLTDEERKNEKHKMKNDIEEATSEIDSMTEEFRDSIEDLTKKFGDHISESIEQRSELLDAIQKLNEAVNAQIPKNEAFDERLMMIEKQINLLFESDKNYIIAYITDIYQRYVKEKKCIDLITLQNVESIYSRFLAETGSEDKFLSKLITELRGLPTTKEKSDD